MSAAGERFPQPSDVEAYLVGQRWAKTENVGSIGAMWVSSDEREDVFVPLHPSFGDYERLMMELTSTIATFEGRPVDDVAHDLLMVNCDVVRFARASTQDGRIPLTDGVGLYAHIRETVRSAAMFVNEPRPYYDNRSPKRVSDVLDAIQLGQTELGSYVVTVVTPLGEPARPDDQLGAQVDEPFERQVMTQLARSVSALQRKVREARRVDDLTPFGGAIEDGVSANLCQAVSKMLAGSDTSLRLEFTWSAARPQPPRVPEATELLAVDAPILQRAVKLIKSQRPRDRIDIVGRVERLERTDEEADGTIGVRPITRSGHLVLVRLNPTEYTQALRAHELRQDVRLAGYVEKRGSVSWVRDPAFHVLGELVTDDADA